jgi:hypothetical protein
MFDAEISVQKHIDLQNNVPLCGTPTLADTNRASIALSVIERFAFSTSVHAGSLSDSTQRSTLTNRSHINNIQMFEF